jgi:hypothetical protein
MSEIIKPLDSSAGIQEIPGYSLNYKTQNGNWVPIPVVYQDMYSTYIAYCTEYGIPTVPKNVYFNALANVVELANVVAGEAGFVPIERGGTGATTVEDARNNLGVYSKQEVEDAVKNIIGSSDGTDDGEEGSLVARVKTLENAIIALKERLDYMDESIERIKTPDIVGIYSGNVAPDENTLGQIYLQYGV